MSAAEQEPPKCSMRVVSLLPSATEMLALIGADIVGRSHECDWPNTVRERVPALTGAYNKFENSYQMHEAVSESLRSGQGLYWLDSELLAQLRPDAIVTQSLCAVCAVDLDIVRKAVAKIFPVPRIIDTNPKSLEDVIADVRRLGAELGLTQRGKEAAAELQARVDKAKTAAASSMSESGSSQPKRVVFLEWTAPLFPGGHWTPQMIHMAGGICPVNPPRGSGGAAPSVETDPSVIVAADPDLIIVAPCGLDLEATRREVATLERQAWWRGLRAVQFGKVVLVDGNQHFNRPGPRLVEALEWLVALLADLPKLMPSDFPWEWWRPQSQPNSMPPMLVEAVEVEPLNCFTPTPSTASEGATAGSKAPGTLAAVPSSILQGGRILPLDHVATAATAASSDCMPGTMTSAATTPPPSCTESLHPATGRTATSAAVAAAAVATSAVTACGALSDGVKDTAAQQEGSGGGSVQGCGDGGSDCSCGGDPTDPWVAACSPWSSAPHLPADIEDLHTAACENGESSYDDPETGFMVFTQLPLAKRGHCCANRCRHCPWGHMRVTAGPRLNRITRPTLLHPSPEVLRAWRQREQQPDSSQQQQRGQEQTRTKPSHVKVNGDGGGGGGGGGGVLKTLWRAVSSGSRRSLSGRSVPVATAGGRGPNPGAVTLMAHEGCSASDSVAKVLADGFRAAKEGDPKQRVVLLVAFDVDSGALWGPAGVVAAKDASGGGGGGDAGSMDVRRDISSYDNGGGLSGRSDLREKRFNAAQLSSVMDTSLRLGLDLVAIPLQVRGRSWIRDQHAVQQALQYVIRVAAELLKENAITRVVSVRPEDGTPPLFVHGMADAVPGGWSEVLRQVNAQLAFV